MTKARKGRIENWSIIPLGRGTAIIGHLYDHPQAPDGMPIRTSMVVNMEGNKVETIGCLYELGEKHKMPVVTAAMVEAAREQLDPRKPGPHLYQVKLAIQAALLVAERDKHPLSIEGIKP